MKRRTSLCTLLVFAITGCSVTNTKHETICADYSLADLPGEYVNVGSEEIADIELLLADVLWASDFEAEHEVHSTIDRIALSFSDEGKLEARGYSGTDMLKADPIVETISIDGNALDVHSDFGFWPGAPGGVVVGPHSMSVQLFLNCDKDLVFHAKVSGAGLAYLLIPIAGASHDYSRFKRVAQ